MEIQPKTVHVNGAKLTYIEQGSGDPVVFVHGTLGDYRSWGFQMEPFARHYRVIAYSRRRHWPNPMPAGRQRCAVAEHADDLAGLIEALELSQPHLIGSSYGAMTVVTMAARRPTLARTLVLGEPPLLPWLAATADGSELYDAFQSGAWGPAREAFRRGESEAGIRRFINGVIGDGAFDGLPSPARARMLDNAPAMEVELETPPPAYYTSLTCEDARNVRAPVLLVTGEHSPQFLIRITDKLEPCLGDVERAEIPNASHAMHSGNPDSYDQTVLEFLARH